MITLPIDIAEALERKATRAFCDGNCDVRHRAFKSWISFAGETRRNSCINQYKDQIQFVGDVTVDITVDDGKIVLDLVKAYNNAHDISDDNCDELQYLQDAIRHANHEE